MNRVINVSHYTEPKRKGHLKAPGWLTVGLAVLRSAEKTEAKAVPTAWLLL